MAPQGFLGLFFQPPAGRANHIAILEFDGSGPGLYPFGAIFDLHGYTTLDLAYWGEAGLPTKAALLLGAHYPALVHGVAALTPSDAAICAYPGCNGPAWTFVGRPVPYTNQFDQPHPTDNPAAVIPVGKIHGPVFLDCGDPLLRFLEGL